MEREPENEPRRHDNAKRPYEKPQIIEERKLEALAIVCGGLFDQKTYLGEPTSEGICTSIFS